MEVSYLNKLLNDISSFNNLASCDVIKSEPVQKHFQRIDEILKLLRPILDLLVDSQIASNEQLSKVFEELDADVKEASDLVQGWHPLASKYYFVMQAESLITKIRDTGLNALCLLNSLLDYLPDDLSCYALHYCMRKVRSMVHDQTSSVIEEALRSEIEDSTPNSEIMAKMADLLSLSSNQELLLEAVALEKVKMQSDQDENDTEAKFIDQMICLVTLMHEHLFKVKQSQYATAVPVPADFLCPLSRELMRDPIIIASGQTYERTCIEKWLGLGLTVCPKTRQSLLHTNRIPNYTVKALIASWCETNNVEIQRFPSQTELYLLPAFSASLAY